MKQLNSKGMTLVEVLAITIIGAIVTILTIHILSNFLSHEKRITTTNQVRDVADIYLESLSRSLYTLNEKNVCGEIKQSLSEGGYYIGDCSKGIEKITGFKKEDGQYSLFVQGEKLNDPYQNIIISDESKMDKNGNVFRITLVLKYNNRKKAFSKEVHSIPAT